MKVKSIASAKVFLFGDWISIFNEQIFNLKFLLKRDRLECLAGTQALNEVF